MQSVPRIADCAAVCRRRGFETACRLHEGSSVALGPRRRCLGAMPRRPPNRLRDAVARVFVPPPRPAAGPPTNPKTMAAGRQAVIVGTMPFTTNPCDRSSTRPWRWRTMNRPPILGRPLEPHQLLLHKSPADEARPTGTWRMKPSTCRGSRRQRARPSPEKQSIASGMPPGPSRIDISGNVCDDGEKDSLAGAARRKLARSQSPLVEINSPLSTQATSDLALHRPEDARIAVRSRSNGPLVPSSPPPASGGCQVFKQFPVGSECAVHRTGRTTNGRAARPSAAGRVRSCHRGGR